MSRTWRDRDGELYDVDDDERPTHDARACSGFVGEDDDGKPRPCFICRPELGRCPVCRHHQPAHNPGCVMRPHAPQTTTSQS